MFKPVINCVFRNLEPMGCGQAQLLLALTEYIELHVGPAWGVACELRNSPPGEGWELYFLDDADQAGELGVHDAGPDGLPRGFVFVRPTHAAGEDVSVVASHELAEMLVDPGANLGAFTPRGRWAALEVCDPCEAHEFPVLGLLMSSFVYPSWFGAPGWTFFDHLGACRQPWQILQGGYIPIFENGKWSQVFGSGEAEHNFSQEDRRMHRTERRARSASGESVSRLL